MLIAVFLAAAESLRSATLEPDDIDDPAAEIKVIYPKPDQLIAAVDSTFILGNVPARNKKLAYKLFINDHYITIHRDGGFIAFLPVTPGAFVFQLEAFLVDKKKYRHLAAGNSKYDIHVEDILHRLSKSVCVEVPEPLKPSHAESPIIEKEHCSPAGNLFLRTGDRLAASFKGTPSGRAWFAVPGLVDSVPMAETSPRSQPYWGESVFGAGAVPESLKIDGIYTGFYDIPHGARCDSVHIEYFLAPPSLAELLSRMSFPPCDPHDIMLLKCLLGYCGWISTLTGTYAVTVNDPSFPFTVRFTDSVQIIRHRPLKGYFSIFQPEGVRALAVGAEGDWYQLEFSKTQTAWVHKESVERLPAGILPPISYLAAVRLKSSKENLTLEFPLAGKHAFRIIEDDRRTVRIQLFGVTSNTDWIRYDFSDPLVQLATWSQPEEDLYEFKVILARDIWGYDTYYRGNTFFFRINKPPENVRKLKGKKIVVDPGHSSDPGAIGPTGLTESEANLGIALELKRLLVSKGARVSMTRDDNSHVDLYDRPSIAKAYDADLFVSIHNNALPDGVNPFINNGSSTYYYHPHSIELARAIQGELVKATRLGDFGLYHGNLAVNRPTQYPAALVECAFMIIPEQEAMLKTKKFRKKVAGAIVKGIEKFLKGFDDGK